MIFKILLIFLWNVKALVVIKQDLLCQISIIYKNGHLKEPQPLLLFKNNTNLNFIYPINDKGIVNILANNDINLACPGVNNEIVGIENLKKNTKEITAKCVKDQMFVINASILFDFQTVRCKKLPAHIAIKSKTKCYKNSVIIDIGFKLSNNNFLKVYEVCYDNTNYSTHFTKFKMTNKIGNSQNYPRPDKWWLGDFYDDFDLDKQYKIKTQLNTIASIVGSKNLAEKYIKNGTNRFLSRGHMIAKADFVYGSLQTSTFWYLNSAPQWQSFNGGNWNTLESNVRKYVRKSEFDLEIYTGVYDQMTLIDVNQNKRPVFIYVDDTKKALPVPKYYWKILYEPITKSGVAFIGLNDPYILNVTSDIYICPDISNKIKWLTWKSKNITKGLSYSCSINSLKKVIPSIPNLNVKSILH